jgi:hypothetical protein
MANFIYVFGEEAYQKLMCLQYQLIKADTENHLYIFLNTDNQLFTENDFKYVLSDTLTF